MSENTGEKMKSQTLEALQLAEQALKSVNKRMNEELERANHDWDVIDEIHRKYEGIRSKCFDQIHVAEVNYWNSGDYIPKGQSFNEEFAEQLQKKLKDVENITDKDAYINISWSLDSDGGMYENIGVEEFKKRLRNNISANLKKPGEFVREDADLLSRYGKDEVGFEEYEVRKGTPEKVGIYSTYY